MAQDTAGKLVQIRLLPEYGQVKGGDTIWIGVEQSIAPHWHTYWKNPGDSGTPTRIEWTLPQGFSVSDIHWPAPKKLPYGPLLNYGYEDNVILLQELSIPKNLPEGPITLSADLEILVCKEECIPEYGTYSLTLNGVGSETEDNSAYLATAHAKVPQQTEWHATFHEENNAFIITLKADEDAGFSQMSADNLSFFPADWGLVDNPENAEITVDGNTIKIKQPRGERPLSGMNSISGVLKHENGDKVQAFNFSATPKTINAVIEKTMDMGDTADYTIIKALLFAFIGGLILNLMPCVFPVLSIKALSLVKTAEKHPVQARIHGIAYTLGVLLSFLAIAGLLILLQASGAQIGWGFQLQNPFIVGLLAYLLFIIGLNLLGVFEFSLPFANAGGALTQHSGYGGSFFTGVLATLVAAPCTAPFMAGAIGFAFTQPPVISLIIFAALGLGLAAPYLILSFTPQLQHVLPKPGPWMNTFKQFLAFPMFVAALWLVWVLSEQTGTIGMSAILLGMVLIRFSIWLFAHKPQNQIGRGLILLLSTIAIGGALLLIPHDMSAPANAESTQLTFGETFSEQKLEQALAGDNPVFVEMTAAWCITCKVNHAVALNIDSTKELFKNENVTYLIGDWTNEDPVITKYLNRYGRAGVPLYVLYGKRNPQTNERPEPQILPQVLSPATVKEYIAGSIVTKNAPQPN